MDGRIVSLLSGLGVETLGKQLFEVRREPKSWRSEFLTVLDEIFPTRVLWSRELSPGDGFESISTLPHCWSTRSHIDVDVLLDQLYQGGWAMFFGQEDMLFADAAPPEYLPTDVGAIEALLKSTGAQVLILSWYDDNEWVVATSC